MWQNYGRHGNQQACSPLLEKEVRRPTSCYAMAYRIPSLTAGRGPWHLSQGLGDADANYRAYGPAILNGLRLEMVWSDSLFRPGRIMERGSR